MKSQITPKHQNKSQSSANDIASGNSGETTVFQFADNHSGTVLQRQQQELIQRQPEGTTANPNGLPIPLKTGIEQLSGIAMNDVRVHYNSAKPAQFQAHAYARGTDIHLAAGQEKHLAHEAWHVVQQKQGRVQPTMEVNGAGVNMDKGLEREADRMGAKALASGKDLSKVQQGGSTKRNVLSRKRIHLGKDYSKDQPKDIESTGRHGKLKNKGTMNTLIAPIQRVDGLPSLGDPSKRPSAVGNPQVSSRPPARRGSGDTGWLDSSMLMRFCKLEHEYRGQYLPPGLSPAEKEKMGFRHAKADIDRIKEWIELDYEETLWKIGTIKKYIDNPEKIPFQEGSVTNLDQIQKKLIKLQEIQMIWLDEIVKYGERFDLGLKAVYSRTESDGALTKEAFRRAGGGGDSKLGHLAPIAKSIFNLLLGVFE